MVLNINTVRAIKLFLPYLIYTFENKNYLKSAARRYFTVILNSFLNVLLVIRYVQFEVKKLEQTFGVQKAQ